MIVSPLNLEVALSLSLAEHDMLFLYRRDVVGELRGCRLYRGWPTGAG